jgi:hypothetical protein
MTSARSTLLLRIEPATGSALTVRIPGDARFSATVPGGYEKLTATIPWSRNVPAPVQLAGAPVVQVVDRGSGQIVWHGRISDPGQRIQPGLDGYALTAVGEKALLDGLADAWCIVDRDPASWVPLGDYPAGTAQVGVGAGTLAASAIDGGSSTPSSFQEEAIPTGVGLPAGTTMSFLYRAGQGQAADVAALAQVTGSTRASTGAAGASWTTTVRGGNDETASTVLATFQNATSQTDWQAELGAGTWLAAARHHALMVRTTYSGAAVTATTATDWVRHANLTVLGRRFMRDGTEELPTAETPDAFRPSVADVVNDVIGRLMRTAVEVDPQIQQPTTYVDQACWWKGVTARQVLDFTLQYAPFCWWAVWAPRPTERRPRFQYGTWQTPIRYILGPNARVRLAGGSDSVANRALVVYLAAPERPATVVVTATVPVLDDEGLTRTVIVDVTDKGPMSVAAATTLGQNAISRVAVTKPSGQATVAEPILDLVAGRYVQPWEILPGSPIMVTRAAPRLGAIGTTDTPDGVAIFRLTGVSYDVSAGAATLDLDGGTRTLKSRIKADLAPTPYAAPALSTGGANG